LKKAGFTSLTLHSTVKALELTYAPCPTGNKYKILEKNAQETGRQDLSYYTSKKGRVPLKGIN